MNTATPTTELVTIDEAVARLGGRISRSSIYRAAKSGEIPCVRIRKRILVDLRSFGVTPYNSFGGLT
jgi:hypothetical protein